MSHSDRRALSEKQNVLNIFSNNVKAKVKSCSKDFSVSYCKSVFNNNRTEDNCSISQKVKRLKTRKERNQIRGQDSSSCYQRHQHGKKESKEKAQCYYFQDCGCDHSVKHFQKERVVHKPLPPQKLSLITEGRLTSRRGLFSHQVRSVDIERIVKEQQKKHRTKQLQAGEDVLTSSPSLPSSPLISRSESGEGDKCIQVDQKSKRSRNMLCQQTVNSQDIVSMSLCKTDRKRSPTQAFHESVDNASRSGIQCIQRGTEPVVLSSSESEVVHKAPSPDAEVNHNEPHVTPRLKDPFKSQEQTTKTSATIDKRHGFVNTQRLDSSSTKSALLSMDAPQSASGHPFFTTSPALDREKIALVDKNHCQNPGVVSRLADRLCQTLDSLPLRRHCSLLTECREVLLRTLKERHSFPLQHSLHSYFSVERPCSPHITEQARSNSGQRYWDNTHTDFSYAWKNADSQQNANMESWADNGSQRKYVGEDFTHNIANGEKWKQAWGTCSSQDFLTKFPFQNTLGQSSIRAQTQEAIRGKQHFNYQRVQMHQDFTGPEILTSNSPKWEELTSDPLSMQSWKQVKLGSSEITSKDCSEWFEQRKSDPDLDFLLHDDNMRRTHSPLGHLIEVRDWSPQQKLQSSNERLLVGASSTVSASFPPEGFRYEPYYRFPHPFNSVSKTESSAMTLYTQSDKERGLSSFPPQNTYIQYWP